MIDFKACAKRYETELVTSVIPFWENHCVDREFGGYFTSLDRDGSVYDEEELQRVYDYYMEELFEEDFPEEEEESED